MNASVRHTEEVREEHDVRRRLSQATSVTRLRRESFDGADLSSVSMNRLSFDRCSFVGADLRLATLDSCFFKMCDFSRANLRGASMRDARFAGCDMRRADLRDCKLRGASLSAVNTGGDNGRTDITGVDWTGSTRDESTFEDAIDLSVE